MAELSQIVEKVRSKNAGPFWVTVDIFCGTAEAFAQVRDGLSTARIATLFGTEEEVVRRFDIPDLNVVKFSLPRPAIQGTVADRDMHGAGFGALVGELELN